MILIHRNKQFDRKCNFYFALQTAVEAYASTALLIFITHLLGLNINMQGGRCEAKQTPRQYQCRPRPVWVHRNKQMPEGLHHSRQIFYETPALQIVCYSD